jgi:hypothetical protein
MVSPIHRSPVDYKTTPTEDERIPFPYCYTEIIMPEADKLEHRKKFMHEANMRRWQHIYNAKLPVKR